MIVHKLRNDSKKILCTLVLLSFHEARGHPLKPMVPFRKINIYLPCTFKPLHGNNYFDNQTVDCNQHCTNDRIVLLLLYYFVINRLLICNCPVLKDSFKKKYLLVWCVEPSQMFDLGYF